MTGLGDAIVERRIRRTTESIHRTRENLAVVDEQLDALADEARDLEIRSLVSETPLAAMEHREAERHRAALERHRDELRARIAELEQRRDDLLDSMR